MKKFLRFFYYFFLIVNLTSCINQKEIAYFQKKAYLSDTINTSKAFTPRIQVGDILSINVGSLNSLASSFFNPYSTMQLSSSDNSNNLNSSSAITGGAVVPSLTQTNAPGYLVDSAGTIDMPLIGKIVVSGLTTSETRDTILGKLKIYLKEPTVNVRVLNYKISILGEVLRPSVYVIPNERITVIEALSMAGDLTIYAKRTNVMVIRDLNGKKEFGTIDLTGRDVYNSRYYYLHANDIVYVEPGKGRIAQTDKTYQILPIVLSALSFIAIIFTYSHIKL